MSQLDALSAYVQPRHDSSSDAPVASTTVAERQGADLAPFYGWIGERCLVSSRVTCSVRRLWGSYALFCKKAAVEAERFAFTQALATEFPITHGLAGGVCLQSDAAAFAKAYPEHAGAVGGVLSEPASPANRVRLRSGTLRKRYGNAPATLHSEAA